MLEILSLVEKMEAVIEAHKSLLAEYKKSSREVKDKFDAFKLPSGLRLEAHTNQIQHWFDDTVDELQEANSYCVCKKENEKLGFEETFFYTARVNFREDKVKITDELAPTSGFEDGITFKQYQEHFFEVPKQVYDFYIFLGNEGDDQRDFVNMVERMYNHEC